MGEWLDNWLNKSDQRKIGNFSRKVKDELSKLPVLSILGDVKYGGAGLSRVKEDLDEDPGSPGNWIFFYEAIMLHKKFSKGVDVGRGVINPIGYITGAGLAAGLNAADDEYQSFDPQKILGMTIYIIMKKVKAKIRLNVTELLYLAKAHLYLANYSSQQSEIEGKLKKAICFFNLAIQDTKSTRIQAECFFYLSQCYQKQGNDNLYLRSLNVSRKLGFQPAEMELKEILDRELRASEREGFQNHFRPSASLKTYLYTYHPTLEERLNGGWEYTKKSQKEKWNDTKDRLQKYLKE